MWRTGRTIRASRDRPSGASSRTGTRHAYSGVRRRCLRIDGGVGRDRGHGCGARRVNSRGHRPRAHPRRRGATPARSGGGRVPRGSRRDRQQPPFGPGHAEQDATTTATANPRTGPPTNSASPIVPRRWARSRWARARGLCASRAGTASSSWVTQPFSPARPDTRVAARGLFRDAELPGKFTPRFAGRAGCSAAQHG